MKNIMLGALGILTALTLAACGGGGSGGSSVTCAPSSRSPVASVTGNWQIAVTNINSNCPTPPNWITCNVAMSQASDGSVTITPSGNCTVSVAGIESSNFTSISSAAGAVDGTTFYWVATVRTIVDEQGISYDETDTVTCDTVTNFASGVQAQVSSTSSYAGSTGEGTCTSTSTVTFTQI